jgi:hypothetical protein
MSNCLHQLSHKRFIVLAETITGTAVAIDCIGKYSSLFLSTDTCVSHTVAYALPI